MEMENNVVNVTGLLNEMFEDIKNHDLSDFYHSNAYTTTKDDKGYQLKFVIPGAKKSNIELKLKGEALLLNIIGSDEFRPLKESIWCPPEVDVTSVSAKYEDGILVIALPYLKDRPVGDYSIEIE